MSGLLDTKAVVVDTKPANPIVHCCAADTAQLGCVANATIGLFEGRYYCVVRGLALGLTDCVHG